MWSNDTQAEFEVLEDAAEEDPATAALVYMACVQSTQLLSRSPAIGERADRSAASTSVRLRDNA